MSEIKKILAGFWTEMRPIQYQMTQEEKEWFRNFLRAYYLENRSSAAEIAPTREAFFHLLDSPSTQRKLLRYLRAQDRTVPQQAIIKPITVKPKPQKSKVSYIEDVLIEVLDSRNISAVKVEIHAPTQKKLASARFSILEFRIVEVHFMLTPW